MTISGQNFEIYQGDNKQIIITVKDDNDALLNLDGYSAVWCVHNQSPSNIVFQKSTATGGITIPNPANGQLVITLEGNDTATLPPKTYGHQCEILDGLGNHATVTAGYMKVITSITHNEL